MCGFGDKVGNPCILSYNDMANQRFIGPAAHHSPAVRAPDRHRPGNWKGNQLQVCSLGGLADEPDGICLGC